MPGPPTAVIFDCDGVLVDSEELAWSAWRDALAPHGVEVTQADVRDLTGRSEAEVYAAFGARASLPPRHELMETVQSATLDRFAELPRFEDACGAAHELASAGTPLGVASSSPRRRLSATLDAVGLGGMFDAVVAGDEVRHGKPAPDVYVRAAEALGVDPRRCLAVEDTSIGVAAALAAGMQVVAVRRGHVDPSSLGAATLVVDRVTASTLRRGVE